MVPVKSQSCMYCIISVTNKAIWLSHLATGLSDFATLPHYRDNTVRLARVAVRQVPRLHTKYRFQMMNSRGLHKL
jgi:hypothetical protein